MNWLFGRITDISEETYNQISKNLSDSRRARVSLLAKEQDRRRSLMAVYLVQKLLENSKCTGTTLENNANGRPFLSGCNLFVSISHSKDGVACVLSEEPVGIDIEKIRPIKKELIEYVCTDKEKEYIGGAVKTSLAEQRFYEVWTAKEAYFKKHCEENLTVRKIDTFSFEKQTHYIDDFIITIV